MICDDDEFDDCNPLDDEQRDDDEERWTCIGKGCLNPHFIHMRSECFTAEDCEAWASAEDESNA